MITSLQKFYRLGLREGDRPGYVRKALLLNKVVLFFLISGLMSSAYLLGSQMLPDSVNYYVLILSLLNALPIYFNYHRKYDATAFFILLSATIGAAFAPMLIGIDSYAQFLLLIIAGLPFVLFGKEWGNWRLLMSVAIVPIWISLEVYCRNNTPILDLDPQMVIIISYVYTAITFVFAVYMTYNFTRLAEQYGARIKAQREQLNLKTKRLEQHNYMATHDLKTPVANIEGLLDLLKDELDLTNPVMRELLDNMDSSISHANNTILDIIEGSKVTKEEQNTELIDLKEIMADIMKSIQKSVSDSRAMIDIDFSRCSSIKFSKVEIRSILQNLITNALKYSSPKRQPFIQVKSVKLLGGMVSILVEDNGLGIDLNTYKEQLFAKSTRIHTNAEGTGMGLYLIKALIDDCGGTITVESTPDVGSTFVVNLPEG